MTTFAEFKNDQSPEVAVLVDLLLGYRRASADWASEGPTYPNTYSIAWPYSPVAAEDVREWDGTDSFDSLTERATIALVDANAGSWFHDQAAKKVYMRPTTTLAAQYLVDWFFRASNRPGITFDVGGAPVSWRGKVITLPSIDTELAFLEGLARITSGQMLIDATIPFDPGSIDWSDIQRDNVVANAPVTIRYGGTTKAGELPLSEYATAFTGRVSQGRGFGLLEYDASGKNASIPIGDDGVRMSRPIPELSGSELSGTPYELIENGLTLAGLTDIVVVRATGLTANRNWTCLVSRERPIAVIDLVANALRHGMFGYFDNDGDLILDYWKEPDEFEGGVVVFNADLDVAPNSLKFRIDDSKFNTNITVTIGNGIRGAGPVRQSDPSVRQRDEQTDREDEQPETVVLLGTANPWTAFGAPLTNTFWTTFTAERIVSVVQEQTTSAQKEYMQDVGKVAGSGGVDNVDASFCNVPKDDAATGLIGMRLYINPGQPTSNPNNNNINYRVTYMKAKDRTVESSPGAATRDRTAAKADDGAASTSIAIARALNNKERSVRINSYLTDHADAQSLADANADLMAQSRETVTFESVLGLGLDVKIGGTVGVTYQGQTLYYRTLKATKNLLGNRFAFSGWRKHNGTLVT